MNDTEIYQMSPTPEDIRLSCLNMAVQWASSPDGTTKTFGTILKAAQEWAEFVAGPKPEAEEAKPATNKPTLLAFNGKPIKED